MAQLSIQINPRSQQELPMLFDLDGIGSGSYRSGLFLSGLYCWRYLEYLFFTNELTGQSPNKHKKIMGCVHLMHEQKETGCFERCRCQCGKRVKNISRQ